MKHQATLKAWLGETLPRTTREVSAWIKNDGSVPHASKSRH
jgi:hypothetical protein